MKKNKFAKYLFALLIGFISSYICLTPTAYADPDVDVSYFWGVTINFESQSFESEVILDDDGKWDEAYHSFTHTNDKDLNLAAIRMGDTNIRTITTPRYYKLHYMQIDGRKKETTKSIPNTWHKNTGFDVKDYGGLKKPSDYQKWWTKKGENQACIQWSGSIGAAGVDKKYGNNNQCSGRDRNATYTWPGVKQGGDATVEDQAMVTWVSGTLTKNYNEVLAYLLNGASVNHLSMSNESDRKIFMDFATQVAVAAQLKDDKTYSYKAAGVLDVAYKVSKPTNKEIAKLDKDEPGTDKNCSNTDCDFAKYTLVNSNSSLIVRWKVPKGYHEGQRLAGYIEGRATKGDEKVKPTSEWLTFQHVVYQGMFNYYMTGQTSRSASQFYEGHADGIEKMIADLLDNALKGIQRMLGMYSFEELMLNEGSRTLKYWNGVFPATWFSASQYFYLFTFSLSMLILLISLVKLAFEKSLSTVGNVARKVSLMEGIKKTIICSIIVVLFQSIFYIICQVNSSLVLALSGLTEGDAIFDLATMSGGTIASVLIALIFFYIMLKMNFTYMLRAITVLICYLLGPICIMLGALGDKYSMITTNWLKELLGNIFIQTIHAMMLMLFINISRYGANSSIEKIVICYSFVPITEFVRTKLFALGKGIDDVASNMAQTSGAIAGGAAVAGTKMGLGVTKGGLKAVGKGVGAAGGAVGKLFGLGGGKSSGGGGGLAPGRVGGGINTANVTKGQKLWAGTKALASSTSRTALSTVGAGAQLAMGFASGAANEQGRADGFQLHRGIGDLEKAAENVGFGDDYNNNVAQAAANNAVNGTPGDRIAARKAGRDTDNGIMEKGGSTYANVDKYAKSTGTTLGLTDDRKAFTQTKTVTQDNNPALFNKLNTIYNGSSRAAFERKGMHLNHNKTSGAYTITGTEKILPQYTASNAGGNIKVTGPGSQSYTKGIDKRFEGNIKSVIRGIDAANIKAASGK